MEPWQRDYDSWLDNHGNPGIQDEETDEMDYEFAEQTFGVDLSCGHTVYGTEADIDSGIRKHVEFCEVAQEILDWQENGTGNVSANDERTERHVCISQPCPICGQDDEKGVSIPKVELVGGMYQFICLSTGKPFRFYTRSMALQSARVCYNIHSEGLNRHG